MKVCKAFIMRGVSQGVCHRHLKLMLKSKYPRIQVNGLLHLPHYPLEKSNSEHAKSDSVSENL